MDGTFAKYSVLTRIRQELAYGRMAARRIAATGPGGGGHQQRAAPGALGPGPSALPAAASPWCSGTRTSTPRRSARGPRAGMPVLGA